MDSIASADVLAVLTLIWQELPETAKRVRQRIGTVMDWAVAQGYRQDNPAAALTKVLPKRDAKHEHMKALPYSEVATAIATIRASDAYKATVLRFELLVLTAARSGEVRGATWNEIDRDAATWTVPASRMKAGREHRVRSRNEHWLSLKKRPSSGPARTALSFRLNAGSRSLTARFPSYAERMA